MTNSVEDIVRDFQKYKEQNQSWKVKAAKATARGLGKAVKWSGKTAYKYLIQKPIIDRRYTVSAQEFVPVLNSDFELFKGSMEESQALMLYELGISPIIIYRDNPDLFAKGAKILGPRSIKYYKAPFTHPIRVDGDIITIDPPATEETVDFYGFPVSFIVDTKVGYQKHPILFPIRNAGRLCRNDPNWEEDLHKALCAETGEIVHAHFQRYNFKFPGVCNTIDPLSVRSHGKSLLDRYGVMYRLMNQKFKPKEGQSKVMFDALVMHSTQLRDSKKEVQSFLDVAEQFRRFSLMGLPPEVLELLDRFNTYRSLGAPNLSRIPIEYNNREIPPDAEIME